VAPYMCHSVDWSSQSSDHNELRLTAWPSDDSIHECLLLFVSWQQDYPQWASN